MNGNGKAMRLARRLRLAALLVIIGLLVELSSLSWSHPAAFIVFVAGGGAFIGAGVLFYLYSLVWRPRDS
jgi:hypothetical protein